MSTAICILWIRPFSACEPARHGRDAIQYVVRGMLCSMLHVVGYIGWRCPAGGELQPEYLWAANGQYGYSQYS